MLGDYEEAEASECEEPINADEILSFKDKYLGQSGSGGAKGGAKDGKLGAKGGAKGSKGSGMASLSRKIPADITDAQRSTIRDLPTLLASVGLAIAR